MGTRGPHGEDESDDWFDDVEPARALESDPPSAEDDWLVPLAPARPRPELQRRRIAVVGGAVLVVLIAGLAAGGVFSGSTKPRSASLPPVTVPSPATTSNATPSVTVLPTTTLKPGDSGAQVKALQRALKSLGYPVGAVDGQYGPATKTAVAAFQHASNLTADGVFGPNTLNALIRRAGP
ncbi:MAG: peptidoglycan-binding protein [Acidobacteriota bacterium]|nr:peptidoglycan-binding protein [Acidobacteriota bacterium]